MKSDREREVPSFVKNLEDVPEEERHRYEEKWESWDTGETRYGTKDFTNIIARKFIGYRLKTKSDIRSEKLADIIGVGCLTLVVGGVTLVVGAGTLAIGAAGYVVYQIGKTIFDNM